MERYDVIVVGAGPAGSTAARALAETGRRVLVLEKAVHPRAKSCAGWVTPEVFDLVGIDPDEYEREGRTLARISRFVVWNPDGKEQEISYGRTVSYGILRPEFDDLLARRTGAELRQGTKVGRLRRLDRRWIVNDTVWAPVLVGAGGHTCPVARRLGIRARPEPVVASMEIEAPISAADVRRHVRYPNTPELIFCDDFSGYGWYFHKGNVLNIGLGRFGAKDVRGRLARLLARLRTKERIPEGNAFDLDRFRGHAYKLYRFGPRERVHPGVVLVGDSAGVAYNVSGEGIRPAILSALLAARTIADAEGRIDRESLSPYEHRLSAHLGYPMTPLQHRIWGAIPGTIARLAFQALLRRPTLVKEILLDHFFLRHEPLGLGVRLDRPRGGLPPKRADLPREEARERS